jgi:hypothetical protein
MFSPQMTSKSLSHSQNKETELKKREKRKRKVLKKETERKEIQKSLMKNGWIFLERRKTPTSNLVV